MFGRSSELSRPAGASTTYGMALTTRIAVAAIALILGVVGLRSHAQAMAQARGGAGAPPAQSAAAAGRGRGAAATYDYGWKSEEYLLLGDTNRGAGEPMIAVDPTNPKNIIAVAMASLQQVPANSPARGSIGRSTITSMAVRFGVTRPCILQKNARKYGSYGEA